MHSGSSSSRLVSPTVFSKPFDWFQDLLEE